MNIGRRFYWVVALVAVLAIAGAAVTLTSRLTSAGGSTPTADNCDQAQQAAETPGAEAADNCANDGTPEAKDVTETADTKDANDATDANKGGDGEAPVPSGTLDDGKDLLPQAGITIDAAIAAAQGAATGAIGEVDLEHKDGKLVFNVDVGDNDVKVDASNGTVLATEKSD